MKLNPSHECSNDSLPSQYLWISGHFSSAKSFCQGSVASSEVDGLSGWALRAFGKASQDFLFAVFDDLAYFTADVLFYRWGRVRREYFANLLLCSFDW